MSVEIKKFCGALFPKKAAIEKFDLKILARSVQAQNKKHALILIQSKFIEEFPQHVDDYFDPKIWEDRVGLPRPGPNEFSTDFFGADVIWNKDKGEPESLAIVGATDDAEEQDQVQPLINSSDPQTRAYALALFGRTGITSPEYGRVIDLVNDTERTLLREIGEALFRTPAALALLPERQVELIAAVKAKFSDGAQWTTIKSFTDKWLATPPEKRTELESSSAKGRSTINLGGGNKTDRSPDLVHTLDTLKIEIALAVLSRNEPFDIYQIPGSVLQRAKTLWESGCPEATAWFAQLSKTPGILDFSRVAIIVLISTAPAGLFSQTSELISYITKNLTETDHANPDPALIKLACGYEKPDEEKHNEDAAQQSVPGAAGPLVGADTTADGLGETTAGADAVPDAAPAAPARPARIESTPREIHICIVINDTLSGCTDIISKDEATEMLEALGLCESDLVVLLGADVLDVEARLDAELSDNEIANLVVDALDGWQENVSDRLDYLFDRALEWRKTLATYDHLATNYTTDVSVIKPDSQRVTTTCQWRLIAAALQGLCANPALAMGTESIPEIATRIGRAAFTIAEGLANE